MLAAVLLRGVSAMARVTTFQKYSLFGDENEAQQQDTCSAQVWPCIRSPGPKPQKGRKKLQHYWLQLRSNNHEGKENTHTETHTYTLTQHTHTSRDLLKNK